MDPGRDSQIVLMIMDKLLCLNDLMFVLLDTNCKLPVRVVSPTLHVNLTLFVIRCKTNLGVMDIQWCKCCHLLSDFHANFDRPWQCFSTQMSWCKIYQTLWVFHVLYEVHVIDTRWLVSPNLHRTHLPHNFWSSYEYLIHYQSRYSCTD